MHASYFGHVILVKELSDDEYDIYCESPLNLCFLSMNKIIEGFLVPVGYSALEISILAGSWKVA